MKNLRGVFTALGLGLGLTATAQEYQHQIYNEADGLSHPFTYSVFQDSWGYVWVGSENGVSRFDGRKFTNYYRDEQEMTSGYVLAVNEYLGQLIIGTYGAGICRYDAAQDRFVRVDHPDIPRDVRKIFVDREKIFVVDRDLDLHIGDAAGNIYVPQWLNVKGVYQVYSRGTDVFLCTSDGLLQCRWQADGSLWPVDTLIHDACFSMAMQGDTLLYTSASGLWMQHGNTPRRLLWKYYFNHVNQGTLTATTAGQVSFATADTFYTVNTANSRVISRIFQVSTSDAFTSADQHTWIASYGKGIYQVNGNYPVAHFSAHNNNASRRTIVTRILLTGDTLVVLHKRGIEGIPVTPPISYNRHGINDFVFRDVCLLGRSFFTAVYENGSNNVYDPHNRLLYSTGQIIYLLCGSNDGNQLYIGAGDGLYILDRHTGKQLFRLLPDHRVFDLTLKQDRLYLATNKGAYTCTENDYTALKPMDTTRCWKVIPVNDTLFVTANDQGLRLCHPAGTEHYLRTMAIYDLALQPENKCLFIATNQGLFAGWKGQLKPVDLVSNSSHIPVYSLLISGNQLWAGTTDGLYGLDINTTLDALFRPDRTIPLYLSGYQAGNDHHRIEQPIRLSASQPNLVLRFSIPFYQRPLETELVYRINKGTWNSTFDEQVVLNDVPYGSAVVEVFARNRNSVSKTLTLPVFRQAPLYYRAWFITLVIAGVVAMTAAWVYRSYRRRIKLMERRHLEKIQRFELENQALFSLMNPHFIFNSLNNIRYFIKQNMLETSAAYLNKFSDLLRLVLETSERKESTLDEEMRLLQFYIDLENLRFNTKVKTTLEVSGFDRPEQVVIPSMMLQPFVENALWHAFPADQKNPELQIRFAHQDDRMVEISIADNGKGFSPLQETGKKSLGIVLIRKRLAALNALYNDACRLELSSVPGSGTTIRILLPQLNAHV